MKRATLVTLIYGSVDVVTGLYFTYDVFTANVIIFMSTVEWKRNDTNWTRTHVLLSTFITRCPMALTDNLYVTCTKKRRSKRQWREHSMGSVEHGNLFILSLKVNKQHTKPKASLLPHLQKLSNDRLPVGVCILIWQSSSINLGRTTTLTISIQYVTVQVNTKP